MTKASLGLNLSVVGFALLGLGSFAFLTTQIAHKTGVRMPGANYHVSALFDNVGGLRVGSRVSMSGIEIGRIVRIDVDPASLKAVVQMKVGSEFARIPEDSAASINTQGLLGGKFISITNGGSDTFLKEGDRITQTRSAGSPEALLKQLMEHIKAKNGRAAIDANAGPPIVR